MGAEPVTPRIDAVLLLLQRFISEPMFTTLRTKEQLGYIVAINKQSFGE
jgi:secreted Zn-dependent insulinase-like peptidase